MIDMFGLTNGALPALLKGGTFWFTPGGSTVAGMSDSAFYVTFWISFFFFWAITVALAIIMVRYRKRPHFKPKPGPTHNNALEVTWTIIPLILVIWIFWVGFRGYLDLTNVPANSYPINVTAYQWTWLFEYPNGVIVPELHFPVGEPVKLTMESQDVLHSLFIPDFRVKQDVVPGRYTMVWFEALEPGKHHLFCTEYCGTQHSNMITSAIGHTPADFAAWMKKVSDPSDKALGTYGEDLYKLYGCATCHSLDGTAGTGPSFQNVFGYERKFIDGTSLVADENYIRQSMLEPMAHVREGFQPVMPTFKGKVQDDQIRALIAWLKINSDKVSEEEKARLRAVTVGESRDGAAGGAVDAGVESSSTDAAATDAAEDSSAEESL